MARIGLIDVDRTGFPNLAMMKISAYHKALGDEVVWVDPLFGGGFDKVYMSKVFTFSPDYDYPIVADEIERGGTGYDLKKVLPQEIDRIQPDYSIYGIEDTAYGFLTRGCPNRCKWCVVPIKEGKQIPYMDVDDIACGRKKLILMDNNVLASDYGLEQIEKIIKRRYRVDFNQALDARLVTDDIAKMLAQVRWLTPIRFGCDTHRQIEECRRAMQMIDSYRKTPSQYILYTIIGDDINEDYERLTAFKDNKRVRVNGQPYRDFNNPNQIIPQWQKDMARWANRKELYTTCDFKEYEPRKGFVCKEYFR
jgi:hypothetical protein